MRDEAKEVSLYSFVEFCLWNAQDDATNFQRNFSTGEVEIEGSAIYHKTEYRERRNHYAVLRRECDRSTASTPTAKASSALYNGFGEPRAVFENRSAQQQSPSGWAPIGSHQSARRIAAGRTRVLSCLCWVTARTRRRRSSSRPDVINKAPAYKLMEQFSSEAQFDAAFDELAGYWDGLLSIYQVQSGEPTSQPHGQHLEPVSVHGDVQHVPLGQLF